MRWKFVYGLLLCIIAGAALQFASLRFDPSYNRVNGDGLAYYSYLPAWFIYHSFDNSFYNDISPEEKSKYWLNEGVDGAYLPKMTMGLALIWSPFYILADLIAPALGYPKDGWSAPYLVSIIISAFLALLVGSWALFTLLAKRFSNFIASLTVLTVVFGSNLLYYAVGEVSMSHVYSFALCASALLLFENWLKEWKWQQISLTGFLFGLIVLIRPTNVVLFLIPIFLVFKKPDFLKQVRPKQVLFAFALFLLPLIPQLLFWKTTTGEFLYYSYPNEKFFWLHPHIYEGFLSYRNGWLLYSSVFSLLIPGFFALRKIDSGMNNASIAILCVHAYITFSWWCWYYGDSYSIRPMIDIYPVLAFPLAAGLYWIGQRILIFKSIFITVILLLIYNNLLFIKYYNNGLITGSTMSKYVFWSTFLNPNPGNHFDLTLSYHLPDNDFLRQGLPERSVPDTLLLEAIEMPEAMRQLYSLGQSEEFGQAHIIESSSLETHQDQYLRFSYSIQIDGYPENYPILVYEFVNEQNTIAYHALELEFLDLKPFTVNQRLVFLKSPPSLDESTSLKCYVWNKNKTTGTIQVLKLEKVRIAFP